MKAKAILFTGVSDVTVDSVEIPEPGRGEVLLEAMYTLISPGTELRLRAGKGSSVGFPFIPGYSFLGRVLARGDDTTLKEGTLVFCDGTKMASVNRVEGAHCSLAVQPEHNVFVIPEGVDLPDGVAVKLAAIAHRGVRLGQARLDETVAVVGLGVIGQCSARLHALTGARVIGMDLSERRVETARKAGIEAFVPQGPLADAFFRARPEGADVVVDATGSPSALASAMDLARPKDWDDSPVPGARVIIQGSYPAPFPVPYSSAFMKELSLWIPRDSQPRDIRAMLDLLVRRRLSLAGLISAVRAPETAAETYAELATPDSHLMTVAFKWS